MNPFVIIQNLLNQLDLGSAGSSNHAALINPYGFTTARA